MVLGVRPGAGRDLVAVDAGSFPTDTSRRASHEGARCAGRPRGVDGGSRAAPAPNPGASSRRGGTRERLDVPHHVAVVVVVVRPVREPEQRCARQRRGMDRAQQVVGARIDDRLPARVGAVDRDAAFPEIVPDRPVFLAESLSPRRAPSAASRPACSSGWECERLGTIAEMMLARYGRSERARTWYVVENQPRSSRGGDRPPGRTGRRGMSSRTPSRASTCRPARARGAGRRHLRSVLASGLRRRRRRPRDIGRVQAERDRRRSAGLSTRTVISQTARAGTERGQKTRVSTGGGRAVDAERPAMYGARRSRSRSAAR